MIEVGMVSSPVSIVVPAVVKPLTLSNSASTGGVASSSTNGMAPMRPVVSQTAVVTSSDSVPVRLHVTSPKRQRTATPNAKHTNAGSK